MSTEPAARDRTLLIWVEPLLLHEAVTQLRWDHPLRCCNGFSITHGVLTGPSRTKVVLDGVPAPQHQQTLG